MRRTVDYLPCVCFGGKILMKTRLISGSCYVAILVACFCLKIFVHDLFFDGLIYAFSLIGSFEMARATKEKTTAPMRCILFAYALVAVPLTALCEEFLGAGALATGVTFFAFVLAILSLLVLDYLHTSLEGAGVSLLAGAYPTLLLCLLSLVNHAGGVAAGFGFNSNLLVLFIFVLSPCADSIAYVFGISFKKYLPKKMAPNLSPNKTVIGGVGGLVGGMLGALVLYFAYNGICGSFDNVYIWLPVYLAIGLVTAIATAFGDLVESSVKRKLEIKDMGKIMPGHGGVMDRIDGSMFATVIVYAAYLLVGLFV